MDGADSQPLGNPSVPFSACGEFYAEYGLEGTEATPV